MDSEPSLALSILAILLAFLAGSLPFSVWLGKLFLHRDVRRYGDGNPGATNAFRAGGRFVALLALMLDIAKGAAPVGLAYFTLGYRGWTMFATALAPILGHAFSPFLAFKGGKAVAVSLGVWIGLTLWRISLPALSLVVIWTALIDVAGWAVMFGLLGVLVVMLIWLPEPLLLLVLAGQAVILAWKHRADLRKRPRLRAWVLRRLGRAEEEESVEMKDNDTHERRFHGRPGRLRSPERIALLEVQRVVALSTEGIVVANVLDVGTGTGIFAEAFAKLGIEVTGIDANAEMVEIARTYVPAAEFRDAPAEAIPFPDRSFDLVFLGHVLHETDKPVEALKEARRVARRRVGVLEWPYRMEQQGPPLGHRLRPEIVRGLVARAGYIEVEAIELAHMKYYRLTP